MRGLPGVGVRITNTWDFVLRVAVHNATSTNPRRSVPLEACMCVCAEEHKQTCMLTIVRTRKLPLTWFFHPSVKFGYSCGQTRFNAPPAHVSNRIPVGGLVRARPQHVCEHVSPSINQSQTYTTHVDSAFVVFWVWPNMLRMVPSRILHVHLHFSRAVFHTLFKKMSSLFFKMDCFIFSSPKSDIVFGVFVSEVD